MPEIENEIENETLDSDPGASVSHEPVEMKTDNPAEQSDAQRLSGISESVEATGEPTEKSEGTSGEEKPVEKKETPAKEEVPKKTEQLEKPRKDKVQARIDKITRQKYEAQRETEALKVENERLRAERNKSAAEKTEIDIKSREPNVEDYNDDAEYQKALALWAAEKTSFESKQAEQEVAKKEPAQGNDQGSTSQGDWQIDFFREGSEKYDDFEAVVKDNDLPISVPMIEVLQHTQDAADIAYHLGQNPEVAAKIAEMHPLAIAQEYGKISIKLSAELSQATQVDEPAKQESAKQELSKQEPTKSQKITKAPEPINPVGTSGHVTKDMGKMTNAEYRVARNRTGTGMNKE